MFTAYRLGASPAEASVNRHAEIGVNGIDKRYDPLFKRHGGQIPVSFMRALAYSESRLKPDYELRKGIDVKTRSMPSGKKDSYWGLFQVGIKNVLKDYNERHGTSITREQLFDPEINTMLASGTLNRIVRAYQQLANQLDINNMRTDFSNPEFVRLLVAGWNSGYSRRGGVQKVAAYLKSRGIPVNHDTVFRYAKKAGATKFLDIAQYKRKYDWQRRVVRRYFEEKARDDLSPGGPDRGPDSGAGPLVALGVLGLLALAALA